VNKVLQCSSGSTGARPARILAVVLVCGLLALPAGCSARQDVGQPTEAEAWGAPPAAEIERSLLRTTTRVDGPELFAREFADARLAEAELLAERVHTEELHPALSSVPQRIQLMAMSMDEALRAAREGFRRDYLSGAVHHAAEAVAYAWAVIGFRRVEAEGFAAVREEVVQRIEAAVVDLDALWTTVLQAEPESRSLEAYLILPTIEHKLETALARSEAQLQAFPGIEGEAEWEAAPLLLPAATSLEAEVEAVGELIDLYRRLNGGGRPAPGMNRAAAGLIEGLSPEVRNTLEESRQGLEEDIYGYQVAAGGLQELDLIADRSAKGVSALALVGLVQLEQRAWMIPETADLPAFGRPDELPLPLLEARDRALAATAEAESLISGGRVAVLGPWGVTIFKEAERLVDRADADLRFYLEHSTQQNWVSRGLSAYLAYLETVTQVHKVTRMIDLEPRLIRGS